MTTHTWTTRDYANDAAEQLREHHDAINAEHRSQRDEDWHLIIDDRPTLAELESAEHAAMLEERDRR